MKTRLDSARQSVRNFDIASQIITAASRIYHVKRSELESHRRPRRITWPRQLCIYTIRMQTTLTPTTIAVLFNFYTSNVRRAVKAVQDAIDTNPATLREISALILAIDN